MIDRAAVRRELDLEEEALALGALRYRRLRPMPWVPGVEPPSLDEEANLPPGQQLIRLTIEPTAALLKERVAAAATGKAGRRFSALKWLENIDLAEAAYLGARVALNTAAARSAFQGTAAQVGEAIIGHLEMKLLAEKNKAGYVGLIRSQHGRTRGSKKRAAAIRKILTNEEARLAISRAEKLHLGAFVLEALIDATGFFTMELVNANRRGDKLYMMRPTEAVSQWLEKQHGRCELLEPLLLPMVIRPRRWRSPYRGGYLKGIMRKYLMRPPSWHSDKHLGDKDAVKHLEGADLTQIYEAVNHIQDTPWRINRPVLDVIREVWDSGGSIAGLPAREDAPLPAVPYDADTNEDALKRWKREAALVYDANARARAGRLNMQQKLWLAERFAGEDRFWFPHSLDSRGRIYPIPGAGFNPQSDDLGKSLLEFAEGKPLGPNGGYWLAVHIANLFGVDKVSFKERVDWTYSHASLIIDSAVAPLDGQRFWATADGPWMALAASLEFVGFLEQKEDFVSHLPIPLDGSNSGLQHFSALLRDPVGGEAVNLVPSAGPQDVYATVAVKAQAIVDGDDDPMAQVWRGKVTRKITKRPTMTFVYSATRFGMQDMILQTLNELDAENAARGLGPYLEGGDNYHASVYLSHILYGAISGVVAAAQEAMTWLRTVARVAADAGKGLTWTTPDGLPIHQEYRNVYGQKVNVHWQGREIKVTIGVTGSGLDSRSQINGVAPNYVHSLDGAHLRAVARAAKRRSIDSLAVIHDSFGTHAADTDRLVEILRETFVEQYDQDLLDTLYREIRAQLPEAWADQVPPPPARGSLDLGMVRHSPYLFA